MAVVLGCLSLDPSRTAGLRKVEPVFSCCQLPPPRKYTPGHYPNGIPFEKYAEADDGRGADARRKGRCHRDSPLMRARCWPSFLLGIYAILIIPALVAAFAELVFLCVVDLDKWRKRVRDPS